MTTLKQRLVRKKNRKLRRLRELYPDIRIKLFYARDFRAMMLKYGRLGLAESLSGTPGQVVPGARGGRGRRRDGEPGRGRARRPGRREPRPASTATRAVGRVVAGATDRIAAPPARDAPAALAPPPAPTPRGQPGRG